MMHRVNTNQTQFAKDIAIVIVAQSFVLRHRINAELSIEIPCFTHSLAAHVADQPGLLLE